MNRRNRRLGVEQLEARDLFAYGDLDTSFGASGFAATPFFKAQLSLDQVADAALQTDGKIVSVGSVLIGNSNLTGITRHRTDGTLDESFGSGGVILDSNRSAWYSVGGRSVAIQPDGKILVASGVEHDEIRVTRYLEDGSLDQEFGSGGFVLYEGVGQIIINEMVLRTDGRVLLVGYAATGVLNGFATYSTFMIQFDSHGQLDQDFGNGGVTLTTVSNYRDAATDVAIQPDGKIVVAGTTLSDSEEYGLFVARYSESGALDDQFGNDAVPGVVRLDNFGEPIYSAKLDQVGLVVQPSGRIVLAASKKTGQSTVDFTLVGVNAQGLLDTSFGPAPSNGLVVTGIPGVPGAGANDLALATDGSILAIGTSLLNEQVVIVRYSASGVLDPTWDQDGIAVTPTIGAATRILVRNDGSPLAVFNSRDLSTLDLDFGVAQFTLQATLDNGFGNQGIAQHNFLEGNSAAAAYHAVVQGDGKLIQSGVCHGGGWCLSRLDETGVLDSSFGAGGRTFVGIETSSSALPLLNPDGSVVLVGSSMANGVSRLHLARLTRDGVLDTSWSDNGHSLIDVGADYVHPVDAQLFPDGSIVVEAYANYGLGFELELRLFRILPTGILDQTFGGDGSVELSSEQALAQSGPLLLQADGRIIAVTSRNEGNVGLVEIHRRLANGQVDAAWGASGSMSLPLGSSNELLSCRLATFMASGHLLVGCQVANKIVLMRFDHDGALDASFGTNGQLELLLLDSYDADVSDLVTLPSGDFALVGWEKSDQGNRNYRGVIRYYRPDGSVNEDIGESGILRLAKDGENVMSFVGNLTPDGQLVVSGRVDHGADTDFLAVRMQGDGNSYRPWHLSSQPFNVDGDPNSAVTPADALLVVGDLNQWGARPLTPVQSQSQPFAFLDVDGDNRLAPRDALLVINYLNGVVEAEGEGEDAAAIDDPPIVGPNQTAAVDRRAETSRTARNRNSSVLASTTPLWRPIVVSANDALDSEDRPSAATRFRLGPTYRAGGSGSRLPSTTRPSKY